MQANDVRDTILLRFLLITMRNVVQLLEELKKHGGNINTEIHLHDVSQFITFVAYQKS